jgi:hypothetical protein
VAPNKLVAKIASDYKKPYALTVVMEEDVQEFLFPIGFLEIQSMWATPMTLLLRLASETPMQQAGQPSIPSCSLLTTLKVPYPLVLTSVVFCRCSVSVHLGQDCSNPVVLDTQFLNPLLVIGAGLVRDRHIFELSFLCISV